MREGKRLAVCEWTLEGEALGVKFRGRPDFFAFEGRRANLVLDFKFSNRPRVYPDKRLQAALYALMVEGAGFDASELCYGVVVFPRDPSWSKAERLAAFSLDGTLAEVHARCEEARRRLLAGGRTRSVESDAWRAELFRHDRTWTENALKGLLGYWLGERPAEPETRIANKCRACPFNAAGLCDHALAPADTAFQVLRDDAGRVFVTR